jgi:cytochrome c oxidase assembly protein subunit 11
MSPTDRFDARTRQRMALSAGLCVGGVAGMLALAFSAAPLYDLFCRVTGFGGTTQIASAAPSAVLEQTMEVRFDTNVAPGLPLIMRAEETARAVRIGETSLVFFRVTNTSDQPVTAVASYNVTPHKTGRFFQKMQCFCFQEQVIPAGQTVDYPVVFFVDPAVVADEDTEEVRSITLSYTFFRSLEDAAGALETAAGPADLAGQEG